MTTGFPAHAGIIPASSCRMKASCWLPRTRGDNPEALDELGDSSRASPHTRG